MPFKQRFSAVLQIFLSTKGCGCLVEGRERLAFLIAVNAVP